MTKGLFKDQEDSEVGGRIETIHTTVLLRTARILGMEFGIEKWAMKSGKQHMTDGMKLPNHDRIRTLEENETYKYLGILEADTIKQVQMKDMIRKEYLRRTRKLLETKLSSRNLIKGINTWAVPLVRYLGPSLKWTGEELKQLDQRTRKLMTMHKALQYRDDVDRLYVSRKEGGGEDLPASKTPLTHRYNGSKTT